MKSFEPIEFDLAVCQNELDELQHLLDEREELGERDELLPFFRQRPQLSAAIGFYTTNIVVPDRLAYELSIFGDFTCDLAIGDSTSGTFSFVEFEDARHESVFKAGERATPAWSPRFEHGFSQIVDWFYRLDDARQSQSFKSLFGTDHVDYSGLLVIGRREPQEYREQMRWRWRADNVLVQGRKVVCLTYDDLAEGLANQLRLYRLIQEDG